MIRERLTLAAEVLLVDSMTNTVSATKIFEDARVESFPVVLPSISFLTSVTRDEGDPNEVTARVTLRLDEDVLLSDSLQIDFQDRFSARHFSEIQGLVVPRPGLLKFDVIADEDLHLAHYEFRVDAVQPRVKQRTLFTDPARTRQPQENSSAEDPATA